MNLMIAVYYEHYYYWISKMLGTEYKRAKTLLTAINSEIEKHI